MKKIIFYTDSLIMGGAEKIALDYVKLLSETGKYDISLIINEDNGEEGNILKNKIPDNVNFKFVIDKEIMIKLNRYRELKEKKIIYKLPYNYYLKKRRKARMKIKEIIKYSNYDYIIDFYNILPEELVDERVVGWFHTTLENFSSKKLPLFEKKLLKMKKLIVLNKEMKEEMIKKFPNYEEKLEVIYNFFDIEKIKKLSISEEELDINEKNLIKENYFFACSRLDKQKGIEDLIEVYKILKERYNITEKLYIAGEGDQKEKLLRLIKNYKLERDIILLGLQKNPYIWMKKAKFFVHASYKEGLPTVVIEALIANGMVISSDCPVGPKEILENGKDGILFPVGNKEKLVDEILKILNNKYLIENYKKKAEERIKDFSKEKIIEKVLRVLN